jgi:hypothetical protein
MFGLGALGAVFVGEVQGASVLALLFGICFNAAIW